VRFGDDESFEWLWLWLACTLPNALSRMPIEPSAIERGLEPSFRWGTMATTDRATLAYLSLRGTQPTATDADRRHEDRHYEVGVIGHGPDRERLAGQVADQIRTWHHTHRMQAVRLDLQAAGSTPPLNGQFTFATGHQQLALTWV
jgi:protein-L-isoaspartate(D-aspartate) O-methyltransferase